MTLLIANQQLNRGRIKNCYCCDQLELRRLHLDLLYCYKIVFDLVNVNFDDFFALSTNANTGGHKYKLFKPRCTACIRQKNFVDRVINVWNASPSTTNFASLNVFRNSNEKIDVCSFSRL